MAKQLLFSENARQKILSGVDQLCKAVRVTLGPRGRNVVLEKQFGSPTVTNDGITIAKEIEFEEPFENMGAKLLKEVASKTNDVAGDGTTTATVLGHSIIREGLKSVAAGINPMELKRGIDKASALVIQEIQRSAVQIKNKQEISQTAAISANNDGTIGELIAEALEKVGKDGVVTIEESKSMETTVTVVEGMQFDRGYLSPYFVTNRESMIVEMENPLILLYDKKISNIKDLIPILEKAAGVGKPLLIIAEDVEGEALATIILNNLRGTVKSCAVKAPGFGDRRKAMLEDMAILTCAELISADLGVKLESTTLDQLGRAKNIKIDKDTTTIIENSGEKKAVQERISQIKKEIEQSSSSYDKEKLQERLAKLSGGVAVLNIGAATEVEMKEKKHRVEDALSATRAAIEEGIVPGGGIALLRASKVLDDLSSLGLSADEELGVKIVKKALQEPLLQIAINAGLDGSVIVNKALEETKEIGFNAQTFKWVNMIEDGIIDPAKVVCSALQNAASIASLLITTECAITDLPQESKKNSSVQEYDY